VSGLAADRGPIGSAIASISDLTSATAGLLQVGRAPLAADITQLGRLSSHLASNSGTVNTFLQTLPEKMAKIARAASYGSWLNLFLCNASVNGVKNALGGPAPSGVSKTAARCRP
jgi:phospholipid/cholesterol/gamma-HCH transport system substrate-binding protein